MPLAEAYAYAGRVMAENMMFQDAEAGIGAFIAKEKNAAMEGRIEHVICIDLRSP